MSSIAGQRDRTRRYRQGAQRGFALSAADSVENEFLVGTGDILKGAQVVTNPAPERLPNHERYSDLSPTDTTGRTAGSCLGDRQDQGTAGPTARTANIARVPARSMHGHACCSRSGDHGGCDRDLQLLTAHDVGG